MYLSYEKTVWVFVRSHEHTDVSLDLKEITLARCRLGTVHTKGRREADIQTHTKSVKTTPQMTRFRDAKVCDNLVTDEIDDHRIQSDHKCTSGLQNPEGKNSTLGMASAW